MLPLPWWILGVGPEDSDESVEDADQTVVDGQSSNQSTPKCYFRTPSASPFVEPSDQLPKVVDLSTFMTVAKRRSSSRLEGKSPKLRKTSQNSTKSERSFERKETEIMNKSADGQSVVDFDETVGILLNESNRTASPMPVGDVFNETFRFDGSENERNVEGSSSGSPVSRDYPLFFSSFDDTTVIFNNTIAGDLDVDPRNDAAGDWVFKSQRANRTLDSEMASESPFKKPVKKEKIPRGRPKRTTAKKTTEVTKKPTTVAEKPQASRVNTNAEKLDGNEIPSTPKSIPGISRRHTPSRKAKTYKSMRE